MRDDRLLAPTRWTAVAIVPVLVTAFVVLYVFPDRTEQLWAWTIMPTMTPMLMGAGYLAGCYFFLRIARGTLWHRVGIGILGVTLFTTGLLLATLLHWDRFNHDHVSFWAWLGLYVATPLLLPIEWIVNRRTDPGTPEPNDAVLPWAVRIVLGLSGLGVLALAVAMFVQPSLFLERWPWDLTPLTARTLAAFLSFPAVTSVGALFDSRWSSFKIPVQSTVLGVALIGIAVVRAWDEFDDTAATWVYVGALAGTLVGLLALLAWGRRAVARPA